MLTGINGAFAEFNVYGSHTYEQAQTDVPIVVYANGPDCTSASAQTAFATIAQAAVPPIPLLTAEASITDDQGQS